MKKSHLAAFFACFLASSCSKSTEPTPTTPPPAYITTTAGSIWTYEDIDNSTPGSSTTYTITSTNRADTVINGNPYHIYTRSNTGSSEYHFKNGDSYFSFRSLPAAVGGANIESLYLKADAGVNTSWSEEILLNTPLGNVNVTMTYTLKERGISKTVNGINYSNVIHVTGALSAAPPFSTGLTSHIHWYYAPRYGLIQNDIKIDHTPASIHVDTQTKLKSTNF
ncbi:MAG: hypothetical protein EOO07_12350 [Chitinophagaceae bacterium]|nr:MAG: hypothetical protein EOO07_12350 [Chitinophagaceae bacterium]